MEPKVKKGLVIGGSILGVVLICSGIGLGLYYGLSGSSKAISSNEKVNVWGYDDQVSSTGKKVNWYMGTETQVVTGTYGGVAVSSESLLAQQSNYHSVMDDIDILDGVAGSTNGLGYLSSAWISGYEDEKLRMLTLETDEGYLDPTKTENKVDYSNLTPESGVNGVEDEGRTYTEADSDGIDWVDASSITGLADKLTGYNTGLGEIEKVTGLDNSEDAWSADAIIIGGEIYTYNKDDGVWKKLTKSFDDQNMQSTLNIHLKVPETAAEVITKSGMTSEDAINRDMTSTISGLKDAENDYFGSLGKYADDFVLALSFFDYIAYDHSNLEAVSSEVIEGTNTADEHESEFDTTSYNNFNSLYQKITGDSDTSLVDALKAQEKDNSGTYSIKVDGTGTNSGLMKTQIQRFSEDFNTAAGLSKDGITFRYDLVNGGSGEGWKGVSLEDDDKLPDVPADASNDGRIDAFLGTQSRAPKNSEIEGWQYAADAISITGDFYDNIPTVADSSKVIGYTMGIDLPAFFVQDSMVIDYTVLEGDEINFVDGSTAAVGDNIKVKPVGINAKAAREFYQDAATWGEEIASGDVQVELA